MKELFRCLVTLMVFLLAKAFCTNIETQGADMNFSSDVEFLKKHTEVVVLSGESAGARVVLAPAYQGRVMTSTAGGAKERSFGWINYAHIESGKVTPHINVYGGEERFWLGPEGGQFSIFFPPGAKFELADWQTPAAIDTEPFEVVGRNERSVSFRHDANVKNYSGTPFHARIERTVELIPMADAEQSLGRRLPGQLVGYCSTNRLTNIGEQGWKKGSGLLSIWILGMYKPGPRTMVVVPFERGDVATLGPIVNDAYFGKPPAERLKIGDGVMFFSGDGQFRNKIGLSPRRAVGVCGSYDTAAGVLTIVKYNRPAAEVRDYVNSMWEIQKEPYSGDAVNAYNDGPPEPGAKPLGPFYELETSSPALALAAGESAEHVQETYHFEGERGELDGVVRGVLGVSLDEIEAALK